jgi:hypothetical protein
LGEIKKPLNYRPIKSENQLRLLLSSIVGSISFIYLIRSKIADVADINVPCFAVGLQQLLLKEE